MNEMMSIKINTETQIEKNYIFWKKTGDQVSRILKDINNTKIIDNDKDSDSLIDHLSKDSNNIQMDSNNSLRNNSGIVKNSSSDSGRNFTTHHNTKKSTESPDANKKDKYSNSNSNSLDHLYQVVFH